MQSSVLEQHHLQIQSLCQKYHVRRLEVFGSAARGDFDPGRSDLDLLVEFELNPQDSYFNAYFGLREELGTALKCHIDLIAAESLSNPYFIERIARERKILYAA